MELSASEFLHAHLPDRGPVSGIARSVQDELDLGQTIVSAVDHGIKTRWEPACRRAAVAKGHTPEERIVQVRRMFTRELVTLGALTGGTAAFPWLGTGVAVPAALAEAGWVAVRMTDLILTIAVIYGHDEASVEERRAWVLAVLAFGDAAGDGVGRLASEVGKGLGGKLTGKVSVEALRAINHSLGRTIITKYGQAQGVIAHGRVLRRFVERPGNWQFDPTPPYDYLRFRCTLKPGTYHVEVRATDWAGNPQCVIGRNLLRVVRRGAPAFRNPGWPAGLPSSSSGFASRVSSSLEAQRLLRLRASWPGARRLPFWSGVGRSR